jgi:hypothetical protein
MIPHPRMTPLPDSIGYAGTAAGWILRDFLGAFCLGAAVLRVEVLDDSRDGWNAVAGNLWARRPWGFN